MRMETSKPKIVRIGDSALSRRAVVAGAGCLAAACGHVSGTWMRPTPQPFRVVEHEWIPVRDGVRLSARLWLPEGAAPSAAVMECIPYRKRDLYRSYDDSWGAVLAGAGKKEVSKLIRFGLCLGRAFQIKDDLLDMFGKEKEIGKSSLGDLKEGKKTLLLWHTYRNSTSKNKRYLNKVLAKITLSRHDLLAIKKLVMHSGARECLKNDIERLLRQADTIRARLAMRKEYKTLLARLSLTLLAI